MALFDALTDPIDFIRAEIIHDHYIARLQGWAQNLVEKTQEDLSVSVGASMVMAATMPRVHIAPRRVRICPMPSGVPSWTRYLDLFLSSGDDLGLLHGR